jgi:hypothetical protein
MVLTRETGSINHAGMKTHVTTSEWLFSPSVMFALFYPYKDLCLGHPHIFFEPMALKQKFAMAALFDTAF